MKDEMAQQAKDIYSGIKKIFPSSRRSGSFSLGRTSSSSEFSVDALAAAAAQDSDAPVKKKERRPSFSFSGWKERRSSLSSKKKELTTPPSSPPPPVVATTKPAALTRSTSTNSAPSVSTTTAARGLGQYQHTVTVPTSKGDSAYLQPSGFTTTPTALSRSTSHPGHFPAGAATAASSTTVRTTPAATASTSSSHTLKQALASVPVRSSASLLAKQPERTSSSSQRDTPAITSPPAPPVVRKSSLKQQPSPESVATRSSRSQSIVPELPTKSQLTARAHRASYNGFLSRSSHADPPASAPSSRSRTSSYNPVSSSSGPAPVVKEPEKKRRTSFSFSSRHQKNKSAAATSAAATLVVDDVAMIVKKPHANTWDSDSDDDYEDTHRPTRGLDRRSVSMDFMEQNPTHLISKIWRKLPIQARLYSGRGSIDLDMQKDRNSFSRSSTAKQQAEKLGQSNYNKPPSPLPNANVFGDKHIYFNQHIAYFPASTAGEYVALESYDDVLVRVCNFAAHDQRRTATKVQEFLERSMAFLHGTKTKHGNVVSISNEEIRMWRRLARHDWSLEDVTLVSEFPNKTQDHQKDSRSSSAATTESDSDSDDPHQRSAAVRSKTCAMPEDDEDADDEDLSLPPGVDLHGLLTVVNSCVNFGEYLFSFDELDELVRLEFLVEEDGWI